MQTWILVVLFGLGVGLVAALSVALYAFLPTPLMNGATRNGRYWGLGTREQPHSHIAGNRPVVRLGLRARQSA